MIKKALNSSVEQALQKLSETEREILDNIQSGQTSEQIAVQRNNSIRTVEKHRSNIIRKLGLMGKPNAILRWALIENQITSKT